MSEYSKHELRKAQEALENSLFDHIEEWVAKNCDGNIFWSEEYIAPETSRRMATVAWEVFMSSRDGQKFYREQS